MSLITLVYVSSAVKEMTEKELTELLSKSSRNNAPLNVTGLLIYKDGNFMQVLEGEPSVVDDLHKRILQDPRHKGCITLLRKPIESRTFGNWSMGFKNSVDLTEDERQSFSEYLDQPLTHESFRSEPNRALKLLNLFKSTVK